MKKYKVAVVGPIPRDTVITHRNEVFEKYGCVTHTSIALSKLLGETGEVIPVTHIRKRDKQPILEIFENYDNIKTTNIDDTQDRGDVINLHFVDQNKRLEKQVGFMNPIVPEDFDNLLDCDAYVFVPVTSFEVPLQTLKFLKENTKGTIIFDAHGPTNTITITGDRLMKFWLQRDLWLPYIDILKMNLEEAYCSWFEKEYELEDLKSDAEIDRDKIPAFGAHCLKMGVTALFVTVDSDGVLGYWRQDGEIKEERIPSIFMEHVVQTTGCGDSFAGGLAYGILKDPSNYPSAARYGNAMGAQRTQGKTFEVFKSLQDTNKMIEETYGNV